LCHDAGHLPFSKIFDFTFIDPARRKGSDKLGLGEISPSLPVSLALGRGSRHFQIKLPSGFNPDEHLPSAFKDLPWQWDWIQWGRDVVECVGTLQPTVRPGRGVHLLKPGTSEPSSWRAQALVGYEGLTFQGHGHRHAHGPAQVPEPGAILVMAEPVLKTAGLLDAWVRCHDLQATPWPDLFLAPSEPPVQSVVALGKTFSFLGFSPPGLKDLGRIIPDLGSVCLEALSGEDRFPTELLKSLEAHNRKVPQPARLLNVLYQKRGQKRELLVLERL